MEADGSEEGGDGYFLENLNHRGAVYLNIQVQICGLFIILVIMRFFYGNKKLGLFTEKVFSRALLGSFVSLILDIVSIVLIVNSDKIPEFIVRTVCKVYLISLLSMGFAGFDYILSDLLTEAKYKVVIRYVVILLLAESIAILATPIYWYTDENISYTYGLSTTVMTVFTFGFFAATTGIVIFKRKNLNPRRAVAMGFWMGTWVVLATIQFFIRELLLVGFGIVIGMFIIFVILENPESHQDRKYGCFNSHALLLYLRQLFERGEKCSLVDFSFDDVDVENDYMSRYKALRIVVDFLNKRQDAKVFRYLESEVVIAVENRTVANDVLDSFKKYYDGLKEKEADTREMIPSMKVLVIDDCSQMLNPEDLFSLNTRIQNKLPSVKGIQFEYVSEKDIEDFYRYSEIIKEIANAIADDRVEVFYQPIHSNCKRKFVSCEALARIRKKDGSLLPPGEFIPIAEETGLIVNLGEKVLRKVCEYLKNNSDISEQLEYVEINLSAVQLEEKYLAPQYIDIIKEYGIDARKINFEITESAAIHTLASFKNNMEKFLENGIAFSLDDFGKGQSNLMYVVKMPVSIIKLDIDMTKAYFAEPKAKYVLAATVRMAHELGLHVVAEGVEEKEELEAMIDENIDFIQGYYFSKPLPGDEFAGLLRKMK